MHITKETSIAIELTAFPSQDPGDWTPPTSQEDAIAGLIAGEYTEDKTPPKAIGRSSSTLLSADIEKIIPSILKKIESIDWSTAAENDPNNPEVAKRLKAINQYLIKNIREQTGATDPRENLQYLTGFLASISFANVLNSPSLIKTNAIITSSILTYRVLDLYVQTVILKKEHFERQYKKLKSSFNAAFENGLITFTHEGGEEVIKCDDEFIEVIKALVLAFYKLELNTGIPITALSKSKITDCCINMMRALLVFINGEELEYRGNNEYKKRQKLTKHDAGLISKFEELLNARKSAFIYHLCFPLVRHAWSVKPVSIPSMQEFMRIIRNHYVGQTTFHDSGSSLLKMSFDLENNREIESNHNMDPLSEDFFLLATNSIQDDQKFKRNFLVLNGLLFFSSLLYGMSFNFSSLNLGLYTTFLSAAGAFILAQKLDNIKSDIQEKHNTFKESKKRLELAMKDGFLPDQPDNKISWIKHSDKGHSTISRNFHQLNYVVAKTWEALSIMGHDPRKLDSQNIAITSINLYLAMGSAYQKTTNPHFIAENRQLIDIAAASAELIKNNINSSLFCSGYTPLLSPNM